MRRPGASLPGRGFPDERPDPIGRRRVRLTIPDRVLFPGEGVTKADLAEYYAEIGDVIVPHLRDRPFTLKRYPHGIHGQPYFHKQAPKGKPPWIPTRRFRTLPREGGPRLVDFTLVNEPAAVVWMVQMNCIDMNAWYSRVDKPERPDYVVFDLDPPESRNGFAQAIRVAHLVREDTGGPGAALVREDERRGRNPRAPPDHPAVFVLGHVQVRRAPLAWARGRASRLGDDRVAEEEAPRRARRPPTERPRQDDRIRLLRAAEARRARVDAAALGGAWREGSAARLRDA